MQFLKRHFEKIILSAVLAGLGAAAVWLTVHVKETKKDILKTETGAAPPGRAWTNLDMATYTNALAKLTEAPSLDLTGEHYLFNSQIWKMLRDGSLVKVTKSGVDALSVTDIRPLYFTISNLDRVSDSFVMVSQHPLQKPVRYYATIGEKPSAKKPYPVVGTNSAPGNPSVLILQVQIPETGETVSVSSNAPYRSLELYEVDMKYSASDITNRYTNKYLNDTLQLSEDSFQIITITSNAVTVQDTRTLQKTEKQWSADTGAVTMQATNTIPKKETPAGADSKP
jgi:hypothetical protein